jgi:hypothetical protein
MVGWERKGSFESIPLPDLEVGSNCNELSQQVSPLKRPPCVGFRIFSVRRDALGVPPAFQPGRISAVDVTDFPGLSLEMMHNPRRISVLTPSAPITGRMGIYHQKSIGRWAAGPKTPAQANPRRPAWEYERRLKIKNNGV